MTQPQPWERGGRVGPVGVPEPESTPAYEAFRCYLEMGDDRGLPAVARKLAKSLTLMKRWSTFHDWVERVEAFDQWLGQQRTHAAGKEAAAAVQSHLRYLRGLQAAKGSFLNELARRQKADDKIRMGDPVKGIPANPGYEGWLSELTGYEFAKVTVALSRAFASDIAREREALGLRTDVPLEDVQARPVVVTMWQPREDEVRRRAEAPKP